MGDKCTLPSSDKDAAASRVSSELHQGSAKRSATDVLVELLTTKVRLLSVEQVIDLCFLHAKNPVVIARKHLHRMERKGLVHLIPVMTLKDIRLERPLLDWHPSDGLPDFGHLSWLAEKRLSTRLSSTLVVQATKAAQAQTFGPIGSRPARSQEIMHDLMVSSVFLTLRKESQELAASWKPEDALLKELVAEQGGFTAVTIPDAVVNTGNEDVAIEIIGRYSPQKLSSIHEALGRSRYQLW
jgi:hypothetical protein